MKENKMFFLLVLSIIFCSKTVNAQLIEYFTTTSNGYFRDVLIVDDNIYIAKASKIIKVPITDSTPTETIIDDGGLDSWSLTFDGSSIYCVDVLTENTIGKIDVSTTPETYLDFISYEDTEDDFRFAGRLYILENYLYFNRYDPNFSQLKIVRVDITDPDLEVEVIINADSGDFVVYDGYLYFTSSSSSEMFKINLSASNPIIETVVTNLNGPRGLTVKGDELFFIESGANQISKLNLNSPDLTPTIIVSVPDDPKEIAFKDDDILFIISEYTIYKLSLSSLGLENNDYKNNNIKVFPNPSRDFIQFSGFTEKENYAIYNQIGMKLLEGALNPNEKINITNLRKGIYIISFSENQNLKFIKR